VKTCFLFRKRECRPILVPPWKPSCSCTTGGTCTTVWERLHYDNKKSVFYHSCHQNYLLNGRVWHASNIPSNIKQHWNKKSECFSKQVILSSSLQFVDFSAQYWNHCVNLTKLIQPLVLNRGCEPPKGVNKFPGVSSYAPYNRESLINKFTNFLSFVIFVFIVYLK